MLPRSPLTAALVTICSIVLLLRCSSSACSVANCSFCYPFHPTLCRQCSGSRALNLMQNLCYIRNGSCGVTSLINGFNRCIQCKNGKAYNNQDRCVSCVNYCRRCHEPTSQGCKRCWFYYGLVVGSAPATCQQCQIDKCRLCQEDHQVCTQCMPGYGRNGTSIDYQCAPCTVPNCSHCYDSHITCQMCSWNLGLDNATNTCVPCSQVLQCLKCSYNYHFCTECISPFKPMAGVCTNCSDAGCLDCQSNSSQCMLCRDGLLALNFQCVPCDTNCSKCQNYLNNCTDCAVMHGLNSLNTYQIRTCLPCHEGCVNCTTFYMMYCGECKLGYIWSNQSCEDEAQLYCQCQCPQNCSTCKFNTTYGQAECLTCLPGHGLSNQGTGYNLCKEICGDSIAVQVPCDYFFGTPLDGCTDTCEVEPGFECQKNNQVSVCSYRQIVVFTVVTFAKDRSLNIITLRVRPSVVLHVFKTSNASGLFTIADPAFTVRGSVFDQQRNEFVLTVELTENCFDCSTAISFQPTVGIDERYYATPSSAFTFRSHLYHRSELEQQITPVIKGLSLAATGAALCASVVGMLTKRLAGLEAAVVLQVAWVSLLWLRTPMAYYLEEAQYLKYSAGAAVELIQPSTKLQTLHQNYQAAELVSNMSMRAPHTSVFSLEPSLAANSVILVVLIEGVLLLAVLVVMIWLVANKRALSGLNEQAELQIKYSLVLNERIRKRELLSLNLQAAISFCLQCALYVAIFNVVGLINSAFLFFAQGLSAFQDLKNSAAAITACLVELIAFVLFFVAPGEFDYLRSSFKPSRLAMSFLYFYSLAVAATVLLVCLLEQYPYAPMGPFGLLLLFTLLYRPYKQLVENNRSALAQLTVLLVLGFRVFTGFNGRLINDDPNLIYALCLAVVLSLLAFASLGLVVFHVVYVKCFKFKLEARHKEKVMEELDKVLLRGHARSIDYNESVFRDILLPKTSIVGFSDRIAQEAQQQELRPPNTREQDGLLAGSGTIASGQETMTQIDKTMKRIKKMMQQDRILNATKGNDQIQIYDTKRLQLQQDCSDGHSLKEEERLQENIEHNMKEYLNYKQNKEKYRLAEGDDSRETRMFALEVAAEENRFLRIKNVEQYTRDKRTEGDKNNSDCMRAYGEIS